MGVDEKPVDWLMIDRAISGDYLYVSSMVCAATDLRVGRYCGKMDPRNGREVWYSDGCAWYRIRSRLTPFFLCISSLVLDTHVKQQLYLANNQVF